MTDDDTLDPRDELASAHLDGETTSDEAAQVAADPDLLARRSTFEAVHKAVGADDGDVDPGRRDEAIAAAVAAAGHGTVVGLADRRRLAARRRVQVLGLAAALVLAAAVAIPLLTRDQPRTTTTAASAPKVADRPEHLDDAVGTTTTAAALPYSAAAGTTGGTTGAAGAVAAPTSSALRVVELGSYPDTASLAAAVRAQLSGQAAPLPTAPPDAAGGAQTCVDQARAAGAAGEPVLEGLARVGGRELVVVVLVDGTGVDHLTTLTPAPGCATVSSTRL